MLTSNQCCISGAMEQCLTKFFDVIEKCAVSQNLVDSFKREQLLAKKEDK